MLKKTFFPKIEWIGKKKRARCDLMDPERVKDGLARLDKSGAWKCLAVAAYTAFLKKYGARWEAPTYKATRKLPFIPTEKEIDALIPSCGRKMTAFLQLVKETAVRAGEANGLLWMDVDLERRIVTLNRSEKGGKARILKISGKLASVLGALPRKTERVFGNSSPSSKRSTFWQSRRITARKLGNSRLLRIHVHTLRHWKATMEYHKTKDPFYVKEFLGHRSLDKTALYVRLDKALFSEPSDEFHFATARTVEEAGRLIEVGFEYVCHHEDAMLFRKRK
jgi:integrase